jgi:hypothetical protein
MEIPHHWRLKAQRYRLEGSTCTTCEQLTFPRRPVCLQCTAQLTRIAGDSLPILLTSISLPDIESLIRCQTMERMTG